MYIQNIYIYIYSTYVCTHICIYVDIHDFLSFGPHLGGEGMAPKDGKPFTCQFALDQIQAGHSPAGEEGKYGVRGYNGVIQGIYGVLRGICVYIRGISRVIMEEKMEASILGLGFGDVTTVMENQMQKEMETGGWKGTWRESRVWCLLIASWWCFLGKEGRATAMTLDWVWTLQSFFAKAIVTAIIRLIWRQY